MPEGISWYTVLDLKKGFFCIPLSSEFQFLFAFEWTDPVSGVTQQYAQTVLPQRFWNSQHLFGNALGKGTQGITAKEWSNLIICR